LAFAPSGQIYVANFSGSVFRVDPATGARSPVTSAGLLAAPEGLEVGPARCGGQLATIVGSNKRDRIKASPFPGVIAALGGNDVIAGLKGNDRICGGRGRDRLLGGKGRDRLLGGKGRDRLLGGKGRDILRGGPGRDRLRGGPGRDRERQ
jgi:Ca2+-binding RTX toxin-like protein